MGHYEVLGVTPDASMDEIRARYLALARSAHPDVQSNAEAREGAEDAMRTINAAWAALSDSDEPSFDERDDRPITSTRLPGWLVMAPPGLLISGFGSVVLGSMGGIAILVEVGIFSMVAAGLFFLLAPIVALGASRRSDRRP
jgi:preprotein translocase subunit Sec63